MNTNFGVIGSVLNVPRIPNPVVPISLPTPVLRWKMTEGSGTTLNDSSGNGYTGTLQGSTLPTWNSGVVGGNTVNYLSFNGTTAFVSSSVGVSQLGNAANASLAAWIQISSTGNSWQIGAAQTSGHRYGTIQQAGTIYSGVENESGANHPTCAAIADTNWHFIVQTFNGTLAQANRVNVYIDSIIQTMTQSGAGNPTTLDTTATMGPMYVGQDISDGFFGNQSTVDFQVFNITLTQAQINSLYSAGPA